MSTRWQPVQRNISVRLSFFLFFWSGNVYLNKYNTTNNNKNNTFKKIITNIYSYFSNIVDLFLLKLDCVYFLFDFFFLKAIWLMKDVHVDVSMFSLNPCDDDVSRTFTAVLNGAWEIYTGVKFRADAHF